MVDDRAKERAANGIMRSFAPILVLTILGAGGGGYLGAMVIPSFFVAQAPKEDDPAQHVSRQSAFTDSDGREKGRADVKEIAQDRAPRLPGPAGEPLSVIELPAVIANVSGSKRLIRLQSAVVFNPQDRKGVETQLAALRSDVAAFLATLALSSIEGADGLRRLQEELSERAKTRSEGRIRDFIIEALVVQ